MARNINYKKLEEVKYATMKLIAESGTRNTTISQISKLAKVSKGYLYTHFESKDELIYGLIKEIYTDVFDKCTLISQKNITAKVQLEEFIEYIMCLLDEDIVRARFLISLAHDERFLKEFILKEEKGIFNFADKLLQKGKKEGIFRKNLIVEELLLVIFNLPISGSYYKLILGLNSEKLNINDRILSLCFNALR